MKAWKNKNQKRNYEITNLFWAVGENAPNGDSWEETSELNDLIEMQQDLNDGIDYIESHFSNKGLDKLFRRDGVVYYGKL